MKKVSQMMFDSAIDNIKNRRCELIDDELIDWKEDLEWFFHPESNFLECCQILGINADEERDKIIKQIIEDNNYDIIYS